MPPVRKPKHKRAKHFLREWRIYRGKTQDEVAAKLGKDQGTISRLENTKTPYDQDILERLAEFYECTPGDLISVNPLRPDKPKLIYDRLRDARADVVDRAVAVLDALLLAG